MNNHLSCELPKKKSNTETLQDRKKHTISSPYSISSYPRKDAIPTSVIQQEIWFHENLVENSNAYNIPIALEISGQLNLVALVQAFRIVIQRYEILRTCFYTIGGVPHQRVLEHLDFHLPIISLASIAKELQNKACLDLLFLFSKKSFALDRAPLFRVLCIEQTPELCILSFVIHHLLCDNWSLTLLIQEILSTFNKISNGEPIKNKKPKYQYADYCYWEKEMLTSEETKIKIEYLRNKLRSLNFELKLPYDAPRNFNERAEARSMQFTLDSECVKKIISICKNHQITPYIFFLTAYHILLYKYTFQSNLVVGTSFLNRSTNEDEGLMGPYINVALIDSHINPENMDFASLARQIKKTILEMHTFRFIPTNKMIKSMNGSSRNNLSLTQVFFGFLNFKANQINDHSHNTLSVKLLNQSNELRVYNVAKFDLDLTVWEDESNMGGSLEYMCNVFKDETIRLLIEHYKQTCDCMATHYNMLLKEFKFGHSESETIANKEAIFSFD